MVPKHEYNGPDSSQEKADEQIDINWGNTHHGVKLEKKRTEFHIERFDLQLQCGWNEQTRCTHRMENIEESTARGKLEFLSKSLHTAHSEEHSYGGTQSEEIGWAEVQFRVLH